MKQKIIPLVSIAAGILAFILTAHYLRGKQAEVEAYKARLYEGARKIPVVVAARDVPSGTTIKGDDIGRLDIFESAAPDRVISVDDYALIVGRKTLFELKAMKPVLWSDVEGGGPAEKGLADAVKPGMRALAVAIGGAPGVSGMVQPNDRVDVLGTFAFPSKQVQGEMETVTLTVLQDVTVLATGQQTARTAGGRRASTAGYSAVTLEVTAREAELLVFAQQLRGSLYLTLRNATDMSFENDLPEITFDHLEKKLPEMNAYRQQNIRHKRSLQP